MPVWLEKSACQVMNAQFPNHIILDLYSVQDKPLGGVTRKGKRMKSGVGGWQISWAAVMVHTRLKSLKEPADRIQAFIKKYTDTDSIFRKASRKWLQTSYLGIGISRQSKRIWDQPEPRTSERTAPVRGAGRVSWYSSRRPRRQCF